MRASIFLLIAGIVSLVCAFLSMFGVTDLADRAIHILVGVSFLTAISDFCDTGLLLAISRIRLFSLKSFASISKKYQDKVLQTESRFDSFVASFSEKMEKKVNSKATKSIDDYKCRRQTKLGKFFAYSSLALFFILFLSDDLLRILAVYEKPFSLIPVGLFLVNYFIEDHFVDIRQRHNEQLRTIINGNKDTISKMDRAIQNLENSKSTHKGKCNGF